MDPYWLDRRKAYKTFIHRRTIAISCILICYEWLTRYTINGREKTEELIALFYVRSSDFVAYFRPGDGFVIECKINTMFLYVLLRRYLLLATYCVYLLSTKSWIFELAYWSRGRVNGSQPEGSRFDRHVRRKIWPYPRWML